MELDKTLSEWLSHQQHCTHAIIVQFVMQPTIVTTVLGHSHNIVGG